VDYLEHGRTFPNQRANAGHDQTSGLQIILGKVRSFTSPGRGPSTSSDHCSAAHRYKEPWLRKRAVWEEVWALQRREDAGETLDIAVPPKYKPTDFKTTAYWRNRGKLDVPKERFILCPGAGRGGQDPVLGWAGWDHVNQAQALARLVIDRQNTSTAGTLAESCRYSRASWR